MFISDRLYVIIWCIIVGLYNLGTFFNIRIITHKLVSRNWIKKENIVLGFWLSVEVIQNVGKSVITYNKLINIHTYIVYIFYFFLYQSRGSV